MKAWIKHTVTSFHEFPAISHEFQNEDDIFTLSFKYRTPENHQAVTYFAFTYPFSYNDIQKMLSNIDAKFAAAPSVDNDDIYYVRECACLTIDKRRVDLLTITSKYGMSNEREAKLKNLFIDEKVERPFKFPNKKVGVQGVGGNFSYKSNCSGDFHIGEGASRRDTFQFCVQRTAAPAVE